MRIENLQKSYGSKPLFTNATYHFPEGERIALVGANGAGKTTLLNVLCGLDTADGGQIITSGNASIGYLPQVPNPTPAPTVLEECQGGAANIAKLRQAMDQALLAMQSSSDTSVIASYERAEAAFRLHGGYSLEAQASSILCGLGFSAADLAKSPKALSGGWRMRLELARLFLRYPDFLILDEPTNHLDLPSLVWVENYLKNFRGTLLFVSHDRALLNRLATITLHLCGGELTPYPGNFDSFLTARDERLAQQQSERDQLKRRREQMERFVERFGAKATKATQAQSRLKMIARIRDLEDTIPQTESDDTVHFAIPAPPKSPRIVLKIEGGAIGYSRPLATRIGLEMERSSKVAVIGANGIGKSTLLRTIAGRSAALAGTFSLGSGVDMAYFAQEQTETLDPDETVLGNLIHLGGIGEKEARGILGGFLFNGEAVFKKVKVLSGGEKSRVGLACALAKRAGLLLLDEPTNHLDMASVETLASGLEDYEGTVLFVSHDRAFIDSICTHVFAMLPDGRSMLFPGKLADYARLSQIAGFPNVLSVSEPDDAAKGSDTSKAPQQNHEEVRELKRNRQKLENQLSKLDAELVKLRDKLHMLESKMSSSSDDYSTTAELHRDHQETQEKLDMLEQEWLQAAESHELLVSKLTALGRD